MEKDDKFGDITWDMKKFWCWYVEDCHIRVALKMALYRIFYDVMVTSRARSTVNWCKVYGTEKLIWYCSTHLHHLKYLQQLSFKITTTYVWNAHHQTAKILSLIKRSQGCYIFMRYMSLPNGAAYFSVISVIRMI
jgi:hypothetical protein